MFNTKKHTQGFTFIEVIVTISLFLVLASIGMGAYFRYYSFSLITNDINNTIELMRQTRFKSLKNPDNSDYGIHIDNTTKTVTGFRNEYNPLNTANETVEWDQIEVLNLSLNPDIGVTNEILFEAQTGKTENYGSFTIGNESHSITININSQGVID